MGFLFCFFIPLCGWQPNVRCGGLHTHTHTHKHIHTHTHTHIHTHTHAHTHVHTHTHTCTHICTHIHTCTHTHMHTHTCTYTHTLASTCSLKYLKYTTEQLSYWYSLLLSHPDQEYHILVQHKPALHLTAHATIMLAFTRNWPYHYLISYHVNSFRIVIVINEVHKLTVHTNMLGFLNLHCSKASSEVNIK